MHEIETVLAHALSENNIQLTDNVQKKLLSYLSLLQTWNRVFNLTSITKPKEMIYLHLIDSLLIAPFLQGEYFLDVGSGAGLPGIPLSMLNSEKNWVLLDKNSKKTKFLTQVIAELELKNVKVAHQSVEDFKSSHCFDSILSRALGSISLFVKSSQHLICDHGIFIAMKGKYPQSELDELPSEFSIEQVSRLTINGMNNIERHVVCLRKVRKN